MVIGEAEGTLMFLVMTTDDRSGGGALQRPSRQGWQKAGDVIEAWLARIRPIVTNADEAYENGRIRPPGHAASERKEST